MGDMELDDDEYDESDGDESDAEEGEVRAPRMKTVGAQTGGVREAGKKVKPRTTRVQRLGDATARLRVMTPFFQLVDMRDPDESSDVSLSDSDTEAPEIINPPPSLPRDGADYRLQPGSGPPQPADSSTAGPAREHRK